MADITAGLLVVCGSSTGLPLVAGIACVYSLMFSFLCLASTFPSQETVNSVFDNPLCEGLFQELSVPLGMDDRTLWKCISYILLRSDHLTYTSSTK